MKKSFICNQCGDSFERESWRKPKFCSNTCKMKWRWAHEEFPRAGGKLAGRPREPIPVHICEQCGNQFQREAWKVKGKQHLFCCREHSTEWQKEHGWPGAPERTTIGNHRVENANCYLLQAKRMLEGKPVNKHCVELPEVCL